MAFTLTKRFAILCEGPADQVFLAKLLAQRKITDFDVPQHAELGKHRGVAGLAGMLRSLAGDPAGYARLKGVLIIADSSSDAGTTFKAICKNLKRDGPFVAPARFKPPPAPNQIAEQPLGHPNISIMLLPLGGVGALETICVQAIAHRRPWLATCVETYLACGEIKAMKWRPEKRDKARLQCMIAALYEKDPNKGLQYLLHVRPPMIEFRSKVFTPVAKQIERFRDEVNAR